MTTYRVKGFDPMWPQEAFEAFRFVLREAAGCEDRVCFTAHTDDLQVIRDLAATHIPEVSLFGWKELPLKEVWGLNMLPSFHSASVLNGPFHVTAREHWELPFYDWSEAWTTLGMLTLRHSVPKQNSPLANQMQPEMPVSERLAGALSVELGCSHAIVGHSSTMLNNQVVHIYNARLPLKQLAIAFRAALSLLLPAQVLAGFELRIAPDQLKQLLREITLAGLPFPDEQLCLSPFGNIFAIASQGVSYPVPNLALERAGDAVERGWVHRNTIRFQSLMRGFLSWRSPDGQRSSRTMGNYAILKIEKNILAIEIGIEQFGDKDVPVRLVKKELERILKSNQLYLERL